MELVCLQNLRPEDIPANPTKREFDFRPHEIVIYGPNELFYLLEFRNPGSVRFRVLGDSRNGLGLWPRPANQKPGPMTEQEIMFESYSTDREPLFARSVLQGDTWRQPWRIGATDKSTKRMTTRPFPTEFPIPILHRQPRSNVRGTSRGTEGFDAS